MIGRQKSKADKKAFIIGDPIEQSLSPKIHGYWLDQDGVNGSYEAFSVPPAYLTKFVNKLCEDGYVGGNVTIPHKEKIILLCDEVSDIAKKIGAVNTLKFEDGKIYGDNTDGYGFVSNIQNSVSRETFSIKGKNALILGAGGASRAIIYALQQEGAKVAVCNRTLDRAIQVAKHFDCEAVDWEVTEDMRDYNLLINTTSLGMVGEPELDIDLSTLPRDAMVTDIVYNPLQTALLIQAQELGLKTVDGLGMLLHQAVPGYEKWFGKRSNVDADLRKYVEKCLAEREAKWKLEQ